MNKSQRLDCLSLWNQARRSELALPLRVVEEIDEYLSDTWDISLLNDDEGLATYDRGSKSLHTHALDPHVLKAFVRFEKIENRRLRAIEAGRRIPTAVDKEFYDLISDRRFLGVVHSRKRSEILDSLALLTVLVDRLEITGPILDLGCHVGYLPTWIAQRHSMDVTGVDRSFRAIKEGKHDTRELANLTLKTLGITRSPPDTKFELVSAIDVLECDVAAETRGLQWIARSLVDGGVAVIAGLRMDTAPLSEIGGSLDLGLGMADLLGGWNGVDSGWGTTGVIVLVKGVGGAFPEDEEDLYPTREWDDHFKSWANSDGIPLSKKTQAYFRAHLREG